MNPSPDVPASRGAARWVAPMVARSIAGFARAATGVRARWHDGPHGTAPSVFFANHTSHGDFVLVWTALPPALRARTRPVAAADYWQRSALRRFVGLEVFRALPVDRGSWPRSDRQADPVAAMAQCLRGGDSLILFPEGTRNTGDDALLPFKSGLFHLARACPEVPLVPVWIENLRRVLPKGSVLPVPLACSVDLGTPLHLQPGEARSDFLARARAALLALRPDPGEPMAETNETSSLGG